MTPVNPFILKNKEKMIAFLDELSVSQSVKCCSFMSEIQGQSQPCSQCSRLPAPLSRTELGQSVISESVKAFTIAGV